MTEQEKGLCVHVCIENQPLHDVTQCFMHLPNYLQACGTLQNLQRHNNESQEGNMRAMVCDLYSEIMGKARTICLSSHAVLVPSSLHEQHSIISAQPNRVFLSLQPLLSLQPVYLWPPGHSRAHKQTTGLYFCVSLHSAQKNSTLKSNYCTWTDPEYILVTPPSRPNQRAAMQDFGAPEEIRIGRRRGHGELIVGCFLSSRG